MSPSTPDRPLPTDAPSAQPSSTSHVRSATTADPPAKLRFPCQLLPEGTTWEVVPQAAPGPPLDPADIPSDNPPSFVDRHGIKWFRKNPMM